jgi:hypothetical protein
MNPQTAPRLDFRLRRTAAVSGLGASVAFVVGAGWLQLAGVEAIDAPGTGIRDSAADHRASLLACYAFWNAGIVVQLVFLVALSLWLYRLGHVLLAAVGALASAVLTSVMVVGYAFLGALAFRAADLSAEQARLLNDLFYLSLSIAGFPGATVAVALSLPMVRGCGLLGAIGWLGIASAAVHIETALALATSGPWSPAGWGGYVAPALFLAWMFFFSTLALRGDPFAAPRSGS